MDLDGYTLFQHDMLANNFPTPNVNYITKRYTAYFYTCESDGAVRQWSEADLQRATEFID